MDDETLRETEPLTETEESLHQTHSRGQTPHDVVNRSFSEGEVDLSTLAKEFQGMDPKT